MDWGARPHLRDLSPSLPQEQGGCDFQYALASHYKQEMDFCWDKCPSDRVMKKEATLSSVWDFLWVLPGSVEILSKAHGQHQSLKAN